MHKLADALIAFTAVLLMCVAGCALVVWVVFWMLESVLQLRY
jgi:hypothetical protein